MAPGAAVILSTYNRPEALELTLAGLARQSDRDFEVVVADDGSGTATRSVVERASAGGLRVLHVWQQDRGFRKARILNRAVAGTGAELLLFLDQDAIPARDWVAVHKAHAARNRFCPGGFVALTPEQSARLSVAAVRDGAHERLPTREQLVELRYRHLRNLVYIGVLMKSRPRLVGMNFSVARDLYERVNGFDAVYEGYGKEDSDLRTRMRRAGGQARCVWHKAVVFHVWHAATRAEHPA